MTVRIEFDGGNGCNSPKRGYGNGYGSYRYNQYKPVRVQFGRPMSNNAAEIWTLAAAVESLAREVAAADLSLLIVGDSQIALKWAKLAAENRIGKLSKGASHEMKLGTENWDEVSEYIRRKFGK